VSQMKLSWKFELTGHLKAKQFPKFVPGVFARETENRKATGRLFFHRCVQTAFPFRQSAGDFGATAAAPTFLAFCTDTGMRMRMAKTKAANWKREKLGGKTETETEPETESGRLCSAAISQIVLENGENAYPAVGRTHRKLGGISAGKCRRQFSD